MGSHLLICLTSSSFLLSLSGSGRSRLGLPFFPFSVNSFTMKDTKITSFLEISWNNCSLLKEKFLENEGSKVHRNCKDNKQLSKMPEFCVIKVSIFNY